MNYNDKRNVRYVYDNSRIIRGTLTSFIILILAIYLSFKCNKGFKLSSIIYAVCFSPYFVLYKLINGIDKCFRY